MRKIRIILHPGEIYGRLTIISFAGLKSKVRMWNCKCTCGNNVAVSQYNLNDGQTKSCGCLMRERLSKASTRHGEAKKTKEYKTWAGIKYRCYCKTDKRFSDYGGRGIIVCDRWLHSFENFLADMGRAPSPKHSIDRKDNNKNYEPNNCRWATNKEQANNKRTNVNITYKGETMTISEWCTKLDLCQNTIRARISSYGWATEDAFTIPIKKSL